MPDISSCRPAGAGPRARARARAARSPSPLPRIAHDRVGPAAHRQLAPPDRLPAGGADRQRVELLAAHVLEHDRLLAGLALPVAPLLEGQHDGAELETRIGEVVLVARWSLRVPPSLEESGLLEPAQPRDEHIARRAGVAGELLEAPVAVADLAHDEQGVLVADDREGVRHRA